MLDQRKCLNCDVILWENQSTPCLPCPVCGCMARKQYGEIAETVELNAGHRLAHKRQGNKRPLAEERNELSYFVKDGEWHRRYLLVDRVTKVYRETITRHATGEILLDKCEHLPDHIGHGDDKGPRK